MTQALSHFLSEPRYLGTILVTSYVIPPVPEKLWLEVGTPLG
jgi:hypothetical protein